MKLKTLKKQENPSNGLKTISEKDGLLTLKKKDRGMPRLQLVKLDRKFLTSRINLVPILKHPLMILPQKNLKRKPLLRKVLTPKKLKKLRKKLIKINQRKN